MLFCPTCGNVLLIEEGEGSFRYFCKTCPYIFNINKRIKRVETFEDKKEVVFVYDKDNMNKGPITENKCPKCGNNKAYYREEQIRSADEAATIIYTCTKCGEQWRQD